MFIKKKKKKKNQLKVIVLELVDYSNQFNLGLIFVSKDATLKPPIKLSTPFASLCLNNFYFSRWTELWKVKFMWESPDVEEMGQIILIGILLGFVIARHGLVKESIVFSLHST